MNNKGGTSSVVIPRLRRNSLAGALSGVASAWVMERFQNFIYQRLEAKISPPRESSEKPATVVAASCLYETVLRRPLPRNQEKTAGELAHYAMGANMGVIYAELRERLPKRPLAAGLFFGTLVFIFADELMNAALGFADPPWKYPPRVHLYALVSHWVYGASLAYGVEIFP